MHAVLKCTYVVTCMLYGWMDGWMDVSGRIYHTYIYMSWLFVSLNPLVCLSMLHVCMDDVWMYVSGCMYHTYICRSWAVCLPKCLALFVSLSVSVYHVRHINWRYILSFTLSPSPKTCRVVIHSHHPSPAHCWRQSCPARMHTPSQTGGEEESSL